MLYKDILFNNQGIKEVRCANEVIWRKKVEQLLRVKFPSADSTNMWLSCLEVRKEYVYALVRTSGRRSSIVKMKKDGDKLSLIGQLSINSVSSVLVVDPRNKDLVYVVAPKSENDIYLNLLCVDTVNWRTKPMSDMSVKNCYNYGYCEGGILLYNGFEMFVFDYKYPYSWSYDNATFDDTEMNVTKLEPTSRISAFFSFSKNDRSNNIIYLGIYRPGGENEKLVLGNVFVLDNGNKGHNVFFTDPMGIPFYMRDKIYQIFLHKITKGSAGYISPLFVTGDGYVYIIGDDKYELFKNDNVSDYTKRQSYAFRLLDCGTDSSICAYDNESKILTVLVRESDYEQTKKEFLKSYLIDYDAQSSNKNLSPKWIKEITNERLSPVFYGNKTSLIHSRRSENDSEIIFGYEKFKNI